jgi:hypothetical protein
VLALPSAGSQPGPAEGGNTTRLDQCARRADRLVGGWKARSWRQVAACRPADPACDLVRPCAKQHRQARSRRRQGCCGPTQKTEGHRPSAQPAQDKPLGPARTTGRRPEGTDHLPRRNQGWRYCARETRRRTPAIILIRGGPPRVSSRAAGEGSRPSYRAAWAQPISLHYLCGTPGTFTAQKALLLRQSLS